MVFLEIFGILIVRFWSLKLQLALAALVFLFLCLLTFKLECHEIFDVRFFRESSSPDP
jgi:hypothetical protein